MSRVTVLVPVRDGAAFLPPTLASLARLRGDDVEILVVDDGSVDATPALLAAAARRDARLRVLRRPAEGLVAALNAGLEAATGELVARLDADDLAHPDRLIRQRAAMRRHGWTVCGSGVRCFPTQAISDGLRRYEAWQNGLVDHTDLALARFVESPLVHPSVMFERAAVERIGGYVDRGWPEDYDLWLRLFEVGATFGKVSAPLTFWRDHPGRVTRTAAHCRAEAVRACRAHYLLRGPARGRALRIAGTGRDAKRLARLLVAGGATLRGWLDINPRRLGQRIHGAPVERFEDAPLRDDEVLLVAVGSVGRRDHVRALFAAEGLVEGHHFWCVA